MSRKKKKVLIVKFAAIGDTVHATIIATAIKQAHPDWEVHFLASEYFKQFLSCHPHIDKVFEWNAELRHSRKYFFETVFMLAKERYDYVFNLTRSPRNYLLSYLMLPKKVINKRNFKNASWVEEYFLNAKRYIKDLVLPEKCYWGIDETALKKIETDISRYPRPFVILSPGGIADNHRQGRTWGIDNWNKFIALYKENFPGTIFVLGATPEIETHSGIVGAEIFTGKYTMAESSAFLSLADLVVAGDTGPAHVAAACGVNTLALLGSTSPDKIKPFGAKGYFVDSPNSCKHCWQKKCKYIPQGECKTTPCMNAITPELVIEEIKQKKLL